MIKKLTLKLPSDERIRSAILSTAGVWLPTEKSPDELLGDFFHDAQRSQVYKDGKTFVDLVPKMRLVQISREYDERKHNVDFDMKGFIEEHFYVVPAEAEKEQYTTEEGTTVRKHITALWPHLTQRHLRNRGTLVGLPYSYIVAGGRFAEQYYWDTYFTMLGLAADDRWDMVENMTKNCAYMIRKFGHVPNASRTYYLSRSQPPFFVFMVRLLASHNGHRNTLIEYLPYMLAEYRFWMRTRRSVSDHPDIRAYERVVEMPDGSLLNRYFDNKTTPRPESFHQDMETAEQAQVQASEKLYLDLRAGAESGWDFCSRWFKDPMEITTIHTTDIVPVDLNSLLYQLELTIAETYDLMHQPMLGRKFRGFADARAKAMHKYLWNKKEGFFMDYDFHERKSTHAKSLAAVFPLFVGLATPKQADEIAAQLERDFLKKGGLVSTLVTNGQQWDSPNGWAPLNYVAIQGLRSYGHAKLAEKVKKAWVTTCVSSFERDHKLVEKYDVVNPDRPGGGGEYTLQDGFGWTNGVLAVLLDEDKETSQA